MKVLIRKSLAGSEYWDTESKRTLFVPKGTEPNFEVIKNPKSMITPEGTKPVIVAIDETAIDDSSREIQEERKAPDRPDSASDLEDMTVKELRAYAVKNSIEIPAAIRSKGDILQIIQESEK